MNLNDLLKGIPFLGKKEEKKEEAGQEYREYEDKLIEYLTSPSMVRIHSDDIQIEKYHGIIAAINYPRVVEAGWLSRLIQMNLDFDLSIHITPYLIESTIKLLENETKKQKTDIYGLESEGKVVPKSLLQKHEDTVALLDQIQKGTEKMFDMSLYIDAKAYEKKELESVTKRIRATMNSIMIAPKVPSFQMYKGLRSVLPIGQDELKITRNITSSAAAACFPFSVTSLETHATGILIGFNQFNNIPIILDPFSLANPNILVLGTSGGGKSYAVKLMLMREFLEGTDINIIDPQGEYTDMVTTFSGQVIRIAPDSKSIINPFDLMDQSLEEKQLSLLAFFRVLLGELTETQRAILEDAIENTYVEKGITKDPITWSKEPPILEDLYNQIQPLTKSDKEIIYKPALAVINQLRIYITGPLRFLNQQTKINMENRMISFDIRDIPDVGKGTIMFLLLEYVYNQMKKSKKRKMLVIDEAWTVLSAGDQAEYILRLVKTCRKFNLSLVMLTQDAEDIISSRAGRAVLSNTATKILLKQDTTVIDSLTEKFKLSPPESRFLKVAAVGNALLIAENSRVPIYIHASPEEHRLITTKPEDLLGMEKIGKPKVDKEVEVEFDINKPVQRKFKLTTEQAKYLENIGFMEFKGQSLDGENTIFLIRNETDYDDEHFVLQHLILDEIKKHTDKVMLHYTALPDATFETPDGRIVAIEVETAVSKPKKEEVEKKLKILKRYNDHFFVVSDQEIVEKYREQYGETITRTQVQRKIESYFKKAED